MRAAYTLSKKHLEANIIVKTAMEFAAVGTEVEPPGKVYKIIEYMARIFKMCNNVIHNYHKLSENHLSWQEYLDR